MKSYRLFIIALLLVLSACQQNKERAEEPKKNFNHAEAASLNVRLGLAYLKQGNQPRAKRKLLTALSQAPKNPGVNAAMAYLLESTGNMGEAKDYYQKAMALAPNSGAQLNNYGAFLCRQGEYKQADSYFLKAVSDVKYENTAGAYENAGLCAMELSEYDKAKQYFTKALEHDSSRKQSLLELVKLNIKQNQYPEALVNLQKYPKIALDDPSLLKIAANAAQKTGKNDLAAEYNRRVQQFNNFRTTPE